jgi:hypothetical protein
VLPSTQIASSCNHGWRGVGSVFSCGVIGDLRRARVIFVDVRG